MDRGLETISYGRIKKLVEAIEILKSLTYVRKRTLAVIPASARKDSLYNNEIAALEKQLPKKVVDKSLVKDNGSVVGSIGKCPNCNEIIDNTMAVCDCGQKINWSERNE